MVVYKIPHASRCNPYRGGHSVGLTQRQKDAHAVRRIEKKDPLVLVGFRVSKTQKENLRQLAYQKQVSVSAYMCEILENHLKLLGK